MQLNNLDIRIDCEFTSMYLIFDLIFAEVVRAMTYVIQQGWAMYWGTSRWSHVEVRLQQKYIGFLQGLSH